MCISQVDEQEINFFCSCLYSFCKYRFVAKVEINKIKNCLSCENDTTH